MKKKNITENNAGDIASETASDGTREKKASPIRIRLGVDKQFLTIVILLVLAGIVIVASSSYVYAGKRFGDNFHFTTRHILFVCVGFAAMFFVSRIPYEVIRKCAVPLFIISLLMLAAVLVIGTDSNGAKRWIFIGPLSIQPSEIMKFSAILLCADYIDRFKSLITLKGQPYSFVKTVFPFLVCEIFGAASVAYCFGIKKIVEKFFGTAEQFLDSGEFNPGYPLVAFGENAKTLLVVVGIALIASGIIIAVKGKMASNAPDFTFGILPFGLMIVVIAFLLVLEPHMSGLIIITTLIIALMTIGGSSGKYLIGSIAAGGAALFGLLKLLPHSSGRLGIWKDPFSNLKGDGWQPAQSLFAIANGGLWGVGIGQSREKHMYLPEPMNDYIFAIWCEEFGFFGAIIVICMFLFFLFRGIVISLRAPDRFSSLLVFGIVVQVGLQAILNMMVVTNSIPSTGISLPFFSYGGSSLVVLLAEMGVVLSISRFTVINKK